MAWKQVIDFDWDALPQGVEIKPNGYETYSNVRREEKRKPQNMPAIFTIQSQNKVNKDRKNK